MKYKLLEPPSWFTSFDNMTLKQAKVHFEWYVSIIPSRIDTLRCMFEQTNGGNKEELDFSVESLKKIWKWFIPLVEVEPKSKEDIEKERSTMPKWFGDYVSDVKLTVETIAVLMDISLYFAEVFIRNNNVVRWGLAKSRSKNYINYNKPVLLGFKEGKYDDELDPLGIIHVQTVKVAFNKIINEDALKDIYNIWKEKIV